MLRAILAACVGLPLLMGCAATMSPPIANPGLGTIADPAVRHGVLENGLTFLIRENSEPRDRAELRLVVNAGSILEDDDQRGLAHMVEHMAFNGTRSFARQELVDYLESVGMRFGPDVNAYTTFDETVYTLTLPTDSVGVLETGIQILEEWASGITFDSLQVELERGVVMEEWRLGQGAASRIQSQQFPTIAAKSRYADRLPIGTPESLQTFSHEALRRYYRDWYRPDLMAVIVVGDFEADSMEAMIRETFARIPAPESPRERVEYKVPEHRETMFSLATDPELTSASVSLYLKEAPEPWRDVADVREWVIEWMASSMLVSRLGEYSVRVDTPILDVSSFQGRFVRTLSTLVLNARVGDGRTAEGLRALLLEVERAARHGFTASELEREKLDKLRAMEQRYGQREKTSSGSFAAEYVSYFLQGGSILEGDKEHALYRDLLPGITLKEINSRVQQWTRPANRVIVVSAPEHEDPPTPTTDELLAVVRLSSMLRPGPYRDEVSELDLLPVEPAAGSIVAERPIPEVGVLEWQLSNGATIYLKPTDFREDQVLFAGRSPGGTSLYDDEDHVAALTATAVTQAGGLGDLSTNELRKKLAGKVAGVGADIGVMYEGVSGAASTEDLLTLFQLTYLKFTAPRVDSTAFLAYQAQARATLLNRSANPEVAFQDTLRAVLSQNHPRSRAITADLFEELDLERSYEIYRDRFADASDFSFYLVGSFDPEEVRPFVERYLASLPGGGRLESGRDLGIRPPRGIVRRTVRRGIEPRAATQIVFTGPFDFERANVLAIQSLADVLRIRLRETLREDLSGTYGVTVRGSATPHPVPQYQFTIGFGTDPHRLDELVTVVFQEIDDLRTNGPLEVDLGKVREMQFRARETELRENSFWLNQLLVYDQYGWDIGQIPAVPARAQALDAELIRDTARRYLDPANVIQVSLLPEPREIAKGIAEGNIEGDFRY